MRIIGPPQLTQPALHAAVTAWVDAGKGDARFPTKMLPELYRWAEAYHVDPVGVVAQSWKETGGGTFRGQVGARWHNPCGLKITYLDLVPWVTDGDRPLAHAVFPSWEVGALAHVQHVAAYAGWMGPAAVRHLPIVDPRWAWVAGRNWCEHWRDLGGKWAPSPSYGAEIETLMRALLDAAR